MHSSLHPASISEVKIYQWAIVLIEVNNRTKNNEITYIPASLVLPLKMYIYIYIYIYVCVCVCVCVCVSVIYAYVSVK